MVVFTTNQWAILGLVLLLGWLLGLASRSGGRKWKRAYQHERDAFADYRAESEARTKAANERIADLDRYAPLIGTGTGSAIGGAARGQRDDLSRIRGIDRDLETRLNECGIHSFRDIAGLGRAEEATLEGRLGLEPGRVSREGWRDQADQLARGRSVNREAAEH